MKPSSLFFHFLIAIFFSLLIMLFDSLSWLDWFSGSIETIFRPQTRLLSKVSSGINQMVNTGRYFSSGPARVADLERRLVAAERQAVFSARRQETSVNPSVLEWADQRGFSLIPAQVLSSGSQLIIETPPDFPDTPDLSGKPVVTPDGALVGSVAAVGRWSARVKLLSDSASQIPAAVLNPDKHRLAAGILTGSFGAAITLEKVLTEINLDPDLAVVSTGEDDLFPPDILVGWIGKTGVKQASSVYQKAEVVPAVNLGELQTVFIIE